MSNTTVPWELVQILTKCNQTRFEEVRLFPNVMNFIAMNGGALIRWLYINGDFKMASKLIDFGVPFDTGDIISAFDRKTENEVRSYISEVMDFIPKNKHSALISIVDSHYLNIRVKEIKQSECFYPPDIIANYSLTNKYNVRESIFQKIDALYHNGNFVIRDVLKIASIAVMNGYASEFLMPVSSKYILEESRCDDVFSEHKVRCLVTFSIFDTHELAKLPHELAHLSINYLFGNNYEPFAKDDTDKKLEYHFKSKVFVALSLELAGIKLDALQIKDNKITLHNIANGLISHKAIMAYSVPQRIDSSIKVDLLAKLVFADIPLSERSKTNLLYNWYQSTKASHSTNIEKDIILERISDWVTYPKDQLSVEIIARFVELSARESELGNLTYVFSGLNDFWRENISPKVSKLLENTIECTTLTAIDSSGKTTELLMNGE